MPTKTDLKSILLRSIQSLRHIFWNRRQKIIRMKIFVPPMKLTFRVQKMKIISLIVCLQFMKNCATSSVIGLRLTSRKSYCRILKFRLPTCLQKWKISVLMLTDRELKITEKCFHLRLNHSKARYTKMQVRNLI